MTLDVVYIPLVTVVALPDISPTIVLLKVFVPSIVSLPVFITAPALATLVASVTSAKVSIPSNLVRSTVVIISPDPALDTSLSNVTLDEVYMPLVTVVALPDKVPVKIPVTSKLVQETSVSCVKPPTLKPSPDVSHLFNATFHTKNTLSPFDFLISNPEF